MTARAAGHVDAAFRALLAGNADMTAKELALAQVAHFGQKPYVPGAPTVDACGNGIVFKAADGWRYSVVDLQPDGAHVRLLVSPPGSAYRFIEVHAQNPLDGQRLAVAHAEVRGYRDLRPVSSIGIADGWIAMRYCHGGSLD